MRPEPRAAASPCAGSGDRLTRRAFLRTGARRLAAAVIAGTGAAAAWRGPGTSGHTCVTDGVCRGCPRLEPCLLPQAQSFKAVRAGGPAGESPA